MSYTFQASGSVKVGGCSGYTEYHNYWCLYGIGSIVYLKHKALKGIFEKVVIKEVRLVKAYDPTRNKYPRYGDAGHYYVDTLNAYYTDRDLVNYDDAVALVTTYRARLAVAEQKRALECK